MYFSLVWSRRYEDHRVLQSEGQVLLGESGVGSSQITRKRREGVDMPGGESGWKS